MCCPEEMLEDFEWHFGNLGFQLNPNLIQGPPGPLIHELNPNKARPTRHLDCSAVGSALQARAHLRRASRFRSVEETGWLGL